MKKYLFSSLVLIFLLPSLVFAQKPGWHMLDIKNDSIYGISTNKAYQELLKGKTPVPVIVAILDGGIDTAHEDLKKNLWRNVREVSGDADVDGNGYKGDVLGWNFLGGAGGQITKEATEEQRVYFKYKSAFENVPEGGKVKRKDRDLYKNWLFAKTLVSKKDTVAPIDYRGKEVKDNYADIKDRYYGNANLTGDPYFHGTHVAGIIGAVRGNDKGMDGVADAVQLMGIRVVPNGDEYDKDVALGIRYAVDNGAKIINMSFGKKLSPERKMVEDAIRYAKKKGVLLINAAGNDGVDVDSIPHYPTPYYRKCNKKFSNMITVGASGPKKEQLIASFSNYGDKTVDVFAPGAAVYATVPGNKYQALSGTSMATPVVAGLAALIKAYYPKLTAKQIKKVIEQSVTKIDFPVTMPRSKGRKVAMSELCKTGGIVNAYNALLLAEKM